MKDIRVINTYWKDKIKQFEEPKYASVFHGIQTTGSIRLEVNFKDLSTMMRLTNNNAIAEYTVYLSLFCALLRKYMQAEQVWIASPSVKVNDETLNETLLLFKLNVNPDDSIKDVVNISRSELQSTLIYQQIDFSDIKEHLQSSGVDTHAAFQFCFSYSPVNIKTELVAHSKFHLNIQKQEEGSVAININYDQRKYDINFVKMFAQHYLRLLADLDELLPKKLADVSLVSSPERKKLLEFAGKHEQLTKHNVCEIFHEQEIRFPHKIAVVHGNARISYAELTKKANYLAIVLKEKYGVQEGDFVGVLADYSDLTIVAFLAILKLGCFYVPIDPSLPAERIQFMMEDSLPKAMVIHSNYLDKVILFEVPLFNIDLELDEEIRGDEDRLPIPHATGKGGYIMYTSGSTGKPKGVLIGEKGIVRLVKNTNYINLDPTDNLLAVSNCAFDGSTFDIWGALLNGGTLVIPEKNLVHNFQLVTEAIAANNITVLFITTALFNALVDNSIEAFQPLKKLLFGGEMVSVRHVNSFIETYGKGKLLHVYGPTENTTFSTWFPVDEKIELGKTVPIGKSVAHTSCYILNEQLEMQPVGVAGELYVGGEGLAMKYLHDETLTSTKFISNPYQVNSILYKTGDLCKWLPDGNIEILDRMDNQVKIRGYRIELGEIEFRLVSYPDIKEATVLVKSDKNNVKFLVAFYVAANEVDNSLLRNELQRSLPDYMIPVDFIPVEALPLNSNGKIDKKVLLQYQYVTDTTEGNELPVSKTEARLITIWQQLFGRRNIKVTDSFFDVGGHSLLATELISLIHKEIGVKIEVRHVFIEQTIERLAVVIDNSRQQAFVTIKPTSESSNGYVLSSAQRRMWIQSQHEGGNLAYSISGFYRFEGNLDRAALDKAFNKLIKRHETLRTYFKQDEEGEPMQFINAVQSTEFHVQYYDLRMDQKSKATLVQSLKIFCNDPFDLLHAPLFRAAIYQTSDSECIFAFLIHHIVSDGISIEIVINELLSLYEEQLTGKTVMLTPLAIQYKDYAEWQQNQLKEGALDVHEKYWQDVFSTTIPKLNLPLDRPRPALKTFNGSAIHSVIPKETTNKLRKIGQEKSTTLFMELVTGVYMLLHKLTNQDDFVIGSPIAGREHIDLKDQVGCYLNILPLRIKFSEQDTFLEVLENVKQITLNAFEHQALPFDVLVNSLNLKRDLSRNVLFDVLVVLQNKNNAADQFVNNHIGLKASAYELEQRTTSQLDLSFDFKEMENEIGVTIEYNSDLFDHSYISDMSESLKRVFDFVTSQPNKPILEFDFFGNVKEQLEFAGVDNEKPENTKIAKRKIVNDLDL